MQWEDDLYIPGKSRSPSAEEGTGEASPLTRSPSAARSPIAETGFPDMVDGSGLPDREVREATVPLSDSEVTLPLSSDEDEFSVPDGDTTPLISETEADIGALWSLQEAMEVFDSSLRSDGSGEVCRLLLLKLLERASSFTYQDCADLRADLVTTCRALRGCRADPLGFEMIVSDLLAHAESLEEVGPAEGEVRVVPVPEAQQRFLDDQQALREFVAERRG